MDENQREEKMKSKEGDWSEMCFDVLQLILESLSFPVFHRARSVCSSWYSVSKSCVRNRYPWLILFPEKFSGSESCELFDPRKDKTFKTKDLGVELSESSCVASYGNWLLMLNQSLDFSILNVFSGERINLPPLSSLRGKGRFRRENNGGLLLVHSRNDREPIFHMNIATGMLWIDEKTKDFVVSWIYNDLYLFSYKKGDDSWWHLQGTRCLSMAYKDQKLCVYTSDHYIKILDFSGDFPKELVEEENPYLNHPFWKVPQPWEHIWKRRIAMSKSGDVLIVLSSKGFPENQEKLSFYVFKMNREGTKWERVNSLGDDEMLVFGDGLTLEASATKESGGGGGIVKSDLNYFVADDVWPPQNDTIFQSSAGVFDLKTAELTWSRFPYCSSSKNRWLVPGSD